LIEDQFDRLSNVHGKTGPINDLAAHLNQKRVYQRSDFIPLTVSPTIRATPDPVATAIAFTVSAITPTTDAIVVSHYLSSSTSESESPLGTPVRSRSPSCQLTSSSDSDTVVVSTTFSISTSDVVTPSSAPVAVVVFASDKTPLAAITASIFASTPASVIIPPFRLKEPANFLLLYYPLDLRRTSNVIPA